VMSNNFFPLLSCPKLISRLLSKLDKPRIFWNFEIEAGFRNWSFNLDHLEFFWNFKLKLQTWQHRIFWSFEIETFKLDSLEFSETWNWSF
jgi:hypothetical protein